MTPSDHQLLATDLKAGYNGRHLIDGWRTESSARSLQRVTRNSVLALTRDADDDSGRSAILTMSESELARLTMLMEFSACGNQQSCPSVLANMLNAFEHHYHSTAGRDSQEDSENAARTLFSCRKSVIPNRCRRRSSPPPAEPEASPAEH